MCGDRPPAMRTTPSFCSPSHERHRPSAFALGRRNPRLSRPERTPSTGRRGIGITCRVHAMHRPVHKRGSRQEMNPTSKMMSSDPSTSFGQAAPPTAPRSFLRRAAGHTRCPGARARGAGDVGVVPGGPSTSPISPARRCVRSRRGCSAWAGSPRSPCFRSARGRCGGFSAPSQSSWSGGGSFRRQMTATGSPSSRRCPMLRSMVIASPCTTSATATTGR